MRIVYVHQYFKTPSMSGGTRSYEMARRFAAAGHDVHVVTTRTSSHTSTGWVVDVVDGITVHWLTLAYDNKMSYRRRMLTFMAFAVRAPMRAWRLKGDVVFASSTPLTVAVPGLIASARRRTSFVFEVRDLWPAVPIAMGALKSRFLQSLAKGLERLAYRRSFAVVALSEGMAEGVRATGCSQRIEVIPNSCDNELFQVDSSEGTHFRQARPWLGSRPLVVYAGTMGIVNGLSYMVALAYEFLTLAPEVRFLVVGDGVERERISKLAGQVGVLDKNFFIEQPVPKSAIPAILSAANVCCSWFVPLREMEANSANKFFDTLAAGRPIVINYGGWQAELIENRSIGLVLDPQDVATSAASLNAFLSNPDALGRARSEATRLALTEFDRDRLAARLLSVLDEAAASNRG